MPLTPDTAHKLMAINQAFYAQFAGAFHRSRIEPAEGFHDLVAFLPQKRFTVLDVGCGNGRFGYFLHQHGRVRRYLGLDASPDYLAQSQQWRDLLDASDNPPDLDRFTFQTADMTQTATWPTARGDFDLVVCLSALHHVPGQAQRQAVVQALADRLAPQGWLLLGNWQFLDSARQRRKIVPWETVGLTRDEVEPMDYLISWNRGGTGFRYVAMIDETDTAVLAAQANLRIVHQYRSDGREGNLNLYTILQHEPTSLE